MSNILWPPTSELEYSVPLPPAEDDDDFFEH
jgi:hypothetical protein